MLDAAFWIMGIAVTAGIGLGCFYLERRPIRGRWRLLSIGHGLLGTAGAALFLLPLAGGLPDGSGLAQVAAWLLGGTLLAAVLVVAYQLRRRKPSGLVVAVHAVLGVAAYVLLTAYKGAG